MPCLRNFSEGASNGGIRGTILRSGRQRRPHERVQLVLPGQARQERIAAGRTERPAADPRVPARGLWHGDHNNPRGAVRTLRRRHETRVHHKFRRPVGFLYGGFLQLRTDARALRCYLPARGGLRGPARPRCREGVHPRCATECCCLRAQLPRHREGDPQGTTRERGLPAGARPPRRRGSASAPCAAAAARRGRGLTLMSDHISGPRALANPIADITDVYAFPSPERTGHLVLVMNTLPFAKVSNAFSDGLIYRFRLRPLTASAAGDQAPFAAGAEEFVFDCVFTSPTGADAQSFDQEGTCTTPSGETVSFRANDEGGGSGHGVRVFAGARWDPFILDAPAALKTVATGQLAFTDPG